LEKLDTARLFDDREYFESFKKSVEKLKNLHGFPKDKLLKFSGVLEKAGTTWDAVSKITIQANTQEIKEIARHLEPYGLTPEEALGVVNSARAKVKRGESFESLLTIEVNNKLRKNETNKPPEEIKKADAEKTSRMVEEVRATLKPEKDVVEIRIENAKTEGLIAATTELSLSEDTKKAVNTAVEADKSRPKTAWGVGDLKPGRNNLSKEEVEGTIRSWAKGFGGLISEEELKTLIGHAETIADFRKKTKSRSAENPSVQIVEPQQMFTIPANHPPSTPSQGTGVVGNFLGDVAGLAFKRFSGGAAKVGTGLVARLAGGTLAGGPVGTAVALTTTLIPWDKAVAIFAMVVIGIVFLLMLIPIFGTSFLPAKL